MHYLHSRIAEPWEECDVPWISSTGHFLWHKAGFCHRDNDLPAMISPNGTQRWYKDGKKHRDRHPAVVYANGLLEYWFEGKRTEFD